jgi:hypothetical protein
MVRALGLVRPVVQIRPNPTHGTARHRLLQRFQLFDHHFAASPVNELQKNVHYDLNSA